MQSVLPSLDNLRLATVKRVTDVTDHLRRLSLSSPSFADYPFACDGAHIGLYLPQVGQPLHRHGMDQTVKPVVRHFTIRSLRRDQCEMDIEFALHGEPGPASRFALRAQPGDVVGISRPDNAPALLKPAAHYYMAGDLTALPAISAMLESMPAHAHGTVALLVPSPADIQDLVLPRGIRLLWLFGEPEASTQLVEAFLQERLVHTESYFWLAGGEDIVLPLRRYLRGVLGIPEEDIYAAVHWRRDSRQKIRRERWQHAKVGAHLVSRAGQTSGMDRLT